MPFGIGGVFFIIFIGIFLFSRWVNILKEYERAVTFWLGRLSAKPKGPGLVLIFWPFEVMVKVSMQTIVHDVPPQDIITCDNVSVKVNAIVYFRVVDPQRAIVEVQNYLQATSQLVQTTLRSVLGQADLAVDRARRLRQDGLEARAAAATHRAAAAMKQPQLHAVPLEHLH